MTKKNGKQNPQSPTPGSTKRIRSSPGEFQTSDTEWREVLQYHFRRRRRQKIWGWSLLALAGLVALNHFIEHSKAFDLLRPLMSPRWQDLAAGFPIAAILLLVAVVLLGQRDDAPKRQRSR